MNTRPEITPCAREEARLLPWLVNGTLSQADARNVASHLEQCPTCRADAAALDQVRTLLRAPAQIEHAPHTGLQRLMARIDASESIAAATRGFQPAGRTARRSGGAAVRWLTAAVVVQAAALAAIGTAVMMGRSVVDAPAGFRTLTTAAAEPAGLRVVFAPLTTLSEVQELLRVNRLIVIAGPTDSGIFTLAPRSPSDSAQDQRDALARLRTDPRVRFAEQVGPDADAR